MYLNWIRVWNYLVEKRDMGLFEDASISADDPQYKTTKRFHLTGVSQKMWQRIIRPGIKSIMPIIDTNFSPRGEKYNIHVRVKRE